jgi:putative transposase
MMQTAIALPANSGLTASACAALGLARASVYRARAHLLRPPPSRPAKLPPPRALGPAERLRVLDLLRTPRFVDQSPAEIYASLLDRGVYPCSIRTLYRILAGNGEVRERRDQLRHPVYQKPELLAEAANQVWSWDITKLTSEPPRVCRRLQLPNRMEP